MPASLITATASGSSGVSSLPALITSKRSPAMARRNPSAICVRRELPVQRNSTFGLIMKPSLAADNLLRFYCLVSGAALRVQKPEQFLQGFGIGRIPEEGALALDAH